MGNLRRGTASLDGIITYGLRRSFRLLSAGAFRDVRADVRNLPRPECVEAAPPALCLDAECLFERLRRNAPVGRKILNSLEETDGGSFLYVIVPVDVKMFEL